ncbi:MAG: hypothetical protein RSC04_06810, partial [Bacteroidales bacterium]
MLLKLFLFLSIPSEPGQPIFPVDEHRNLAISVTDTGCGIPADKNEWVFERFTKNNDFTSAILCFDIYPVEFIALILL